MKQMHIDQSALVQVNYEDVNLPDSMHKLRPVVFRQGDNFCVLLGESPKTGIFGSGPTQTEAIEAWNAHLKDRMNSGSGDDELMQYVRQNMSLPDIYMNNGH